MSKSRLTFRLVRDISGAVLVVRRYSGTWQDLSARDSRSDEAEGLDWSGLARAGTYWGDVLLRAKKDNLVTIPNVDAGTAWCAAKAGLRVVSMKAQYTKMLDPDGRQVALPVAGDKIVPALGLWAFFTSIDFAKKYMAPYFELLEKNEVPDMSLLEWLVTMGGIAPSVARAAVTRYSHPRKGDPVLMHETDRMRLAAAADARSEALAAETPAPAASTGAASRGSSSA